MLFSLFIFGVGVISTVSLSASLTGLSSMEGKSSMGFLIGVVYVFSSGIWFSAFCSTQGARISSSIFPKEITEIKGQVADIKGDAIALKDDSKWTFNNTEMLGISTGDRVTITCASPKFYQDDRTCTIQEIK